jgi:hypothetical protein
MTLLKVSFAKADGTPWNEWDNPSSMPIDMIHFKENTIVNGSGTANDFPELQIFIGKRVICGIDKNYFLSQFKKGNGYEYIEEWKARCHKSMDLLNGSQILKITDMLREYGHGHN